ncbi:tetratricopeptide repeat-containing protein [Niveibacterium sp.]|uniref:tetratricopeptide repeat-containing protein n=1 Tax=Niveibacterium sp. TaxID=2017444 RepID=UPI0035B3F90A
MKTAVQKVCFVVMGFGKKTDYESGRTLDLDATYEAIIKPAAESENLRCIRADEIIHSGVIDTEMYEMLLRADLVIADISTGNINSVYELGVRHALRPNSTILMKEEEGRLHFDLNHVSTFHYRHLGEDIGAREAARAKNDLRALIARTLISSTPDSPVYTYLPKLQQPRLTVEEYERLLDEAESHQETLAELIKTGNRALRESRFNDAVEAFCSADNLKPNDPHVIQQMALATYKSKSPSELAALTESLAIIGRLKPSRSNDPETLGITGAIYKRLWLLTKDRAQLDLAIFYYGRGFDVRRDYYNGQNLAACYKYRSALQASGDEALYDRMSARKTYEAIIEILSEIVTAPSFPERADRKWIYATFANCLFSIGDAKGGEEYESLFYSENPDPWEVSTYKEGKLASLDS